MVVLDFAVHCKYLNLIGYWQLLLPPMAVNNHTYLKWRYTGVRKDKTKTVQVISIWVLSSYSIMHTGTFLTAAVSCPSIGVWAPSLPTWGGGGGGRDLIAWKKVTCAESGM